MNLETLKAFHDSDKHRAQYNAETCESCFLLAELDRMQTTSQRSKKYDRFVAALRALCREHEVQLAPESYDLIQVWNLRPGENEIYEDHIEDKTEPAGDHER